MELFDIILLIIIGGFGLFGLWFGFFHTLGSLLGTMVGVFVASRHFEVLADWIIRITGWDENFSRVLTFTIAFVIINRLVGFLFWIVDRLLSIVTRLPFINGLNKFLGLILGIFEGFITVGFFIHFHELFPFSEQLSLWVESSEIAAMALGMIIILLPLLPDALRIIQDAADAGVERAVEILEDIHASQL